MQQTPATQERTALEALWNAGLSEREIGHLLELKRDVVLGRRSEITQDHKRLGFARYRYERGLLHD